MHKRETMRTRALAIAAVSVCFGLAAPGAFAQARAYTTEPTDLYAGPSDEYPVVAELAPNVPVTVMGCVSDYSWCDVVLPDLRGWIFAGYLAYPYQGGYVPLESYGPTIGLPVVTFALGAYWGSFYRDRPFYGDRDRWAHRPPPRFGSRPPGPPPTHGEVRPGMTHPPPLMRGEARPGVEHAPPPAVGVQPREVPRETPREAAPREVPREAPRMPPQGNEVRPAQPPVNVTRPAQPPVNEARPAQPPVMNAPRQPEQQMARPSVPPQVVAHPPTPPAAAYGHVPAAQSFGGQRPPAPAPGAARPEGAPQGGHAPSQGNGGRNGNEYRQQN